MISIVKDNKTGIDFNKPQLLKMKDGKTIIMTEGKTTVLDGFTHIGGTVVGGDVHAQLGQYSDIWRSDIWVKFEGSVIIQSSNND